MMALTLLLMAFVTHAALGEESHTKKPKRIKVNPADDETVGLNFTEEFNLYRGTVYSNTVIEYATRSAWVFGLQILSGNSNISGGIVNLVFYPLPNLQTYCGVNVPGPHSGNEFSGNLGIIYNLK